MPYVKFAGTVNRHTSAVSEIILEVSNGVPTKVARLGVPVDISKELLKKLERKGYLFQPSSEQELNGHKAKQAGKQVPGSDVVSAAPVFGVSSSEPEEIEEEDVSYDFPVSGPPKLEQRPGTTPNRFPAGSTFTDVAEGPKTKQRQTDAEDS